MGCNIMESEVNVIEGSSYSIRKHAYFFIKRSFDLMMSLVGLIILLPIIIIVKVISLISGDTGSIFYSQDRIGKDGKIFKLYKFRSMIPNADEKLKEILANNEDLAKEYNEYKKFKNDPRVTKIGKILRVTSLDELPQMINIFLGDMSLIGNRPYLPREKKDMGKNYEEIIKTKPGLTGYWQVNGRSDTTFEERVDLESYYSKHCNLSMDIGIFFKTFAVVLFKKGAK